jgi:DNA-binding PadR family transcriptional regulator
MLRQIAKHVLPWLERKGRRVVFFSHKTPKISVPLQWAVLLVLLKAELSSAKICQAITQGTSGNIRPSVGTLYPHLVALKDAGLITEHLPEQSFDGRPRTYYRISELGSEEVKAFFQFHQNFSDLGIALNHGGERCLN